MYGLTKKQKLDFILKKVIEFELTAYDIGKKTNLSITGIDKIISGESKNPHENTLNTILIYLEELVIGTNLNNNSAQNIVSESKNEELLNVTSNPEFLIKCLLEQIKLKDEIARLKLILEKNNINFKE
jgi:hypothetical protein